ncbi:hypothetical protein P389DRAFT_109205 [Cystobasidium minutum MCA 4210]|uniref:uncharacterized protein n=1 Tax=Cystobasidium minutum MCA 4210 TaxID=1397322 RepID=UPI0034D002F0|eukprot:jgi/Rhomi1/109205/CE109204_375
MHPNSPANSSNMPLATGTGNGRPPPRPWFGGLGGWGPGGGGGGGGGRPGGTGRPGDAPPPYSAKPDSTATASSSSSSVWSEIGRDMRRGAAIGVGSTIAEAGINSLLGRNTRNEQQRYQTAPPMFAQPHRQQSPVTNTWRNSFNRDDDRGEGSSGTSGLGSMRTSSGFGGTRNR